MLSIRVFHIFISLKQIWINTHFPGSCLRLQVPFFVASCFTEWSKWNIDCTSGSHLQVLLSLLRFGRFKLFGDKIICNKHSFVSICWDGFQTPLVQYGYLMNIELLGSELIKLRLYMSQYINISVKVITIQSFKTLIQ